MTSLHEFEKYIKSTHVSEIDVISDLLSELVKKETPTTAIQSIPLIQDSLIILGTIRKRKLGGKFNEQHLETIITHSLTLNIASVMLERNMKASCSPPPSWGLVVLVEQQQGLTQTLMVVSTGTKRCTKK